MKFNLIDQPLNLREEGEYSCLKAKLQNEGGLTLFEQERYDDFALRESRLSSLSVFRESAEMVAFGKLTDYDWSKFEAFNLDAKVRRYEHFKKQRTTLSSQLTFIQKERERQPYLKKIAKKRANLLYGGHDESKEEIKLDLIQRVYHEFEQYLQSEEKGLTHAVPSPTMPVNAGLTPLKTMRQVVLMHIYQNTTISHAQASVIAEIYGFSSPTSGQKLYSIYNKLAHYTTDRTGIGARGLRLMITDIQAVLPHLAESGRKQAESELQTLKAQE